MPDVQAEISHYNYELRVTPDERAGLLALHAPDRALAWIAFVEEGQPLPPPQQNMNGTVSAAFRFEQLQETIDMLRNEKPLVFTWAHEQRVMRITTKQEPIGEEEHRSVLETLFGRG